MNPGGRRTGRLSARSVRRGGGGHAGVAPHSGIGVEQPAKAASYWPKPVSAEITELAMPAGSETAGGAATIAAISGIAAIVCLHGPSSSRQLLPV